MTDRVTELVENNIGLVPFVFNNFIRNHKMIDWDEVFSYGYEGLVIAAQTYREGKGATFSTYATRCIYHRMMRYFYFRSRKMRSAMETVSIHQPVDLHSDSPRELIDTLVSDEDFTEEVENRVLVHQLLGCLTPRERWIISHHFGLDGREPTTLKEISRLMNISRERVGFIVKRALRKMKLVYLRNQAS